MMKANLHAASVVGVWRLVSFEANSPEGVFHPFGVQPRGSVIYTDSGYFSAQVMRADRPRLASQDQLGGDFQEIKANFEGVISYYGAYEVDHINDLLLHHVEGSLFPNMEGGTQKRFVEISGNVMRLTTPPMNWGAAGRVVATLEWERVG